MGARAARRARLLAAPTVTPDPSTGVWSAPEVIQTLPDDTWQISLAIDAAGQPHVAWEEDGALQHSWRGTGGWQEPGVLAYGEAPSLAVDAAGTLHALFANSFDDNQEIYHVTFRDGQWSLPVNVSHTTTFSTGPVLKAGPAETPLLATWAEIRPDAPLVYYGFWDGQFWHYGPVTQARGLGPVLAVDDGGPLLAWHARVASDRPYDIYAARRAGSEWSLPENVSDSADTDSVVASVALAPRAWHVAWREGPPSAAGVAYSRRYEAGWDDVASLADVSASPPQVLAAPGGAREVVWLNGAAVWSVRGFGEGDWQTPAPVPPAAANALAVAVAGDSDGGLHLVWAESQQDGTAVLRYARRLGCQVCRALVPVALKTR